VMLDELVRLVQPSGRGRLLDLACGTGQITFAVAVQFAEVWAVDQEPDMIRVVRDKARVAGASHVRTVVSPAEGLDAPPGAFELVAIGNAFHRLRREAVAASAFRWLQPNRCIALLWGTGAMDRRGSVAASDGVRAFQLENETRRRSPSSRGLGGGAPDAAWCGSAGSGRVRRSPLIALPHGHDWSVEALIGFVYSTSFLPRVVLGDRAEMFERDLRCELGTFEARNELRETIDFGCELARRPA
jgi:SAM-dependent methyltransferase